VPVYELTGFAGEPAPCAWETFAAGQARFQAGDFAGAKEIFEQLPDDPAARSYLRRCHDLCAHPPAVWDGVWGLTEK
jgi:hypothetical protein